jgi:hypothetical protein
MDLGTRVLASLAGSVRTTRMVRRKQDGRATWHKQRRRGAAATVAAGNVFLQLARSHLRMFVRSAEWRRWELGCFALLHGPAYASGTTSAREVWFDELPGESCRELLRRGALATAGLQAAARELFRAHSVRAPHQDAPLSHGDPHLGNVIYDSEHDVARLIDFEQAHEDGVASEWRSADDLLVFVLDLLGRARDDEWPALALIFLRAYPERATVAALRARLLPPRGMQAVLWATRTTPLVLPQVNPRLRTLADAL